MDNFKDLEELGIDDDETTSDFQAAANHVQSIASGMESDMLLKLYSYYKQGLEGNCNAPKPSWYDFRAKSKWEAWNALKDLPQQDAQAKYVQLVQQLDPTYSLSPKSAKAAKEGWVTVSTLQKQSESDSENDVDENIIDFVKSGDHLQVETYLSASSSDLDTNDLDADGMGLLHWAADRGSTQIINTLLEYGADVNLRDADGQTALHYASSCGHLDCVELLMSHNANLFAKDNDGLDSLDAASDGMVREFLKACSLKYEDIC